MARDWKDIPEDEILNFKDAHTGQMAQYGRIMQQKTIDALTGLIETIGRSSQGMKDKTDELIRLYDKFSNSQRKQQSTLIILSVVVALSTVSYAIITWKSVTAMRESNEIQRQFLEIERMKIEKLKTPNKPLKKDVEEAARPSVPQLTR